jgi:hypothetical protein
MELTTYIYLLDHAIAACQAIVVTSILLPVALLASDNILNGE